MDAAAATTATIKRKENQLAKLCELKSFFVGKTSNGFNQAKEKQMAYFSHVEMPLENRIIQKMVLFLIWLPSLILVYLFFINWIEFSFSFPFMSQLLT